MQKVIPIKWKQSNTLLCVRKTVAIEGIISLYTLITSQVVSVLFKIIYVGSHFFHWLLSNMTISFHLFLK